MIIKIQRFGGVSGIVPPPGVIDTSSHGQTLTAELQALVRQCNFWELPEEMLPDNPSPDSFQYSLTVNDGGREHTVTLTEGSAPENVRLLIQKVRATMREAKSGGGS